MKQTFTLCAMLLGGAMAFGQTYPVSFAVDMNASNPSADTVIVAGDFAASDASGDYTNWNDGTSNPDSAVYMTDANGDHIWEFTSNLPNGTYQYKFVSEAGSWESVGNRSFTVSGAAVALDTFCFNSATPGACPTTVPITVDILIKIDMSNVCSFDPAVDSLDFAGPYNGWSGGSMLTDPDGDLVYEYQVSQYAMQKDLTTGYATFEYKVRINNNWNTSEDGANRVIMVAGDTVMPVRCYSETSYGACAPNPTPASVTFKVDMANEVPAADGTVWLIGGFTQWQSGALQMTQVGSSTWYEVTVNNFCPASGQYKFVNGNPNGGGTAGVDYFEENADFSSIGGCGVDNGSFSDNRIFFRPADGNDMVAQYVYNTCTGFDAGLSVEENFDNLVIQVVPNPVNGISKVELPAGIYAATIVDMTGRIVRSANNIQNELTIESEGLDNGIYLLILSNEAGVTKTSKFVIN